MSGMYGVIGVLMALRSADATGVGQVIDIGLYEPIFRILDELAPAYDKSGFIRQRMGAPTVNVCPHSHYPTKDDRWVAIACTNDKIFGRLAGLMEQGDVAGDGKYGTIQQRDADRSGVDGMVTDWTMARTQKEVVAQCEIAEVPCGIVAAIDELFKEPHYAARENIVRVKDPRIGDLAVPNVVPRLTETPGSVDTLGPALGAGNDEIYRDMLGLGDDDMAELTAAGVI
jgi:crotonobetainyl-CoA:carnitine CoA-transferase CaiB-like acyl-CoA transferase